MTSTLFKHEWLRTWRWLTLLTLAAILVVGTMSGVSMLLPGPLNVLLAVIAIIVGVGYLFAVPLLISLDFYRSCYSKTGYFTAGIPADGGTIFAVKAGYAYLVTLASLAVGVALQIPASIATGAASGVSASETLDTLWRAIGFLGDLPAWVVILLVVVVLAFPLVSLAPFFFAATVGSESWINRSGFGGVVLTWFLYYVATQAAGMVGLFIPPSLDLRRAPEVSLNWNPMEVFTAGNNAPILPLAVFIVLIGVAIVAMWRAKVSYASKLELR